MLFLPGWPLIEAVEPVGAKRRVRSALLGEDDVLMLDGDMAQVLAVREAAFVPGGAGKGRSCILPALPSYEGPAIVVDIKGENAAVTAPRRRAIRQDMPREGEMLASVDGDLIRAKRPDDLADPRLSPRARPNPLHEGGPVAPNRATLPRGYLGPAPTPPGAARSKRKRNVRAKVAPVHREIMGLLGAAGKA